MKQVLPNIWQWSWFSPEKQLDFNGLYLAVGEHRVLVDPPPLTDSDLAFLQRQGRFDYCVLTNRDHEREAAAYQPALGYRIFVPEPDASEMTVKADTRYRDGELLPGGIWVVQLKDQKSPESALFLQQSGGVMIVGDAVIGRPPGGLSMLPPEKYADMTKAREGLRRLLKYDFEALLVGDGASLLTESKARLSQLLAS